MLRFFCFVAHQVGGHCIRISGSVQVVGNRPCIQFLIDISAIHIMSGQPPTGSPLDPTDKTDMGFIFSWGGVNALDQSDNLSKSRPCTRQSRLMAFSPHGSNSWGRRWSKRIIFWMSSLIIEMQLQAVAQPFCCALFLLLRHLIRVLCCCLLPINNCSAHLK